MDTHDAGAPPPAAATQVSREWLLRMGIAALVFSGFSLWCLYDGLVAYPRHNDRIDMLEAERGSAAGLRVPLTAGGGDQDAMERKTEWDVRLQFVMAAICVAIAVPIGRRILWARSHSMAVDDVGFHTVEGELVPYDAITGLDLSRWVAKSIVTVHYRAGAAVRTTRIDDWVFQGGESVLLEIERRTGLGRQPEAETRAAADLPVAGDGAGAGASGRRERANG